MPTYAAIQFDRFLESGASKTTSSTNNQNVPDVTQSSWLDRRNSTTTPIDDLKSSSRRQAIPPPYPPLRRRNSTPSTAEKRTQIQPALYATPEPTPIPDSPTSFPPSGSPFIINHKRRGPRLLKSLSDQNVVAAAAASEAEAEAAAAAAAASDAVHTRSLSEVNVSIEPKDDRRGKELVENGLNDDTLVTEAESEKDDVNGELLVSVDVSVRENSESENFYDPQESMSYSASADGEDYVSGRSARCSEFYDAWEELSSDSGLQAQRTLSDVETELREMRLTFLMEIEKRKLAEEALQSMQQLWQMLREKLGAVGLVIPADLIALAEDGQANASPIEEICEQIELARFVSKSIGRGIAKAEAEAEMEVQLEMKNFEIARLSDRLHYYETMNQEMSQRNQEAMEIARHERQKRRRRQKWVWGSIIVPAITLGGAALAWSLLPNGSGKGSSSSESNESSKPDSNMQ